MLLNDFRVLKTNVGYALQDYATRYMNRLENGTVRIYHKVRFLLLKRYVDYVVNRFIVYETHNSNTLYEENDIVVSGTDCYIAFKAITHSGIAVTNTEFWSPHIAFTYDYDELLEVLDRINRITGAYLTILN